MGLGPKLEKFMGILVFGGIDCGGITLDEEEAG